MIKKLIIIYFILTAALAARAETTRVALLWIPADKSSWEQTLDYAAAQDDVKFTLAVSQTMLSAEGRARLRSFVSDDKVEQCARIYGDPVLPLLFSPASPQVWWPGKPAFGLWAERLDEAASRLFYELENYKSAREQISGWAPAGGGVVPEMVPLARPYGLQWIASGPPADANLSVRESSGIALVPFRIVRSTEEFIFIVSSAAGQNLFIVVDETLFGGQDTDDNLFAGILGAAKNMEIKWCTVSKLLKDSNQPAAITLEAFPGPWTGDYALWAAAPQQLGAFLNLGRAWQAFNVYRNSGQAKPALTKEAAEMLKELEAAELYTTLASTDTAVSEEAERGYKTVLYNFYRAIERPVPPYLMRHFSETRPGETDSDVDTSTTSASINMSGDSIVIKNPEKTLKIPESFPVNAKAADPYRLFSIDSVAISWTDTSLRFTIVNSTADAETWALLSGQLLLDIYVDMNHRSRSGSTNFLDLRKVRSSPEDAWEYAVSVNGAQASLFRAIPQGSSYVQSFPVSARKRGVITFEIPRELIKGNPKLWGYCVLVMALDGEDTEKRVPRPRLFANYEALVDYIALDRIGSTIYSLRLPRKF